MYKKNDPASIGQSHNYNHIKDTKNISNSVSSQKGYVCLYKKIIDWEWYKEPNTAHLFIHLLLTANYKQGKWKGIDIYPGQHITSRGKLVEGTGLTERQVRTGLNRLESTGEVTIKTTNRYHHITICNWGRYQFPPKEDSPSKRPEKVPTNDHNLIKGINNNKYPFKVFLKEYGIADGKEEAEAIWNTLPEGDKEKIMTHIPFYKGRKQEVKYRRHPNNYLKSEMWKYEDTSTEQLNDIRFIPEKGLPE